MVGAGGVMRGDMSQRDVKTKIVCTIGPASRARATMAAMIEAGMNVARLNFAHGTFEEHAKIIADLRAAALTTGRRLAPSRSAISPAMPPARRPPSRGCRRR